MCRDTSSALLVIMSDQDDDNEQLKLTILEAHYQRRRRVHIRFPVQKQTFVTQRVIVHCISDQASSNMADRINRDRVSSAIKHSEASQTVINYEHIKHVSMPGLAGILSLSDRLGFAVFVSLIHEWSGPSIWSLDLELPFVLTTPHGTAKFELASLNHKADLGRTGEHLLVGTVIGPRPITEIKKRFKIEDLPEPFMSLYLYFRTGIYLPIIQWLETTSQALLNITSRLARLLVRLVQRLIGAR